MTVSENDLSVVLEGKIPPPRYKQTQLHFGISNIQIISANRQTRNFLGSHVQKSRISQRIKNSVSKFQTHLDLGQKELAFSICFKCGMVYNSANSDDWRTHDTLHSLACYPSCLHLSGFIEGTVTSSPDFKIIRIMKHSPPRLLKRARLLWEYLQSDHGFVLQYLDFANSDMQLYIYIHEEKSKIVGCCFAEEISTANRIILHHEESDSPCVSTDSYPVQLGVNRLWVHYLHRRFKVATKLVDCVRLNFIRGKKISKNLLAFSDPSPEGIAFALKYIAQKDFLIYIK